MARGFACMSEYSAFQKVRHGHHRLAVKHGCIIYQSSNKHYPTKHVHIQEYVPYLKSHPFASQLYPDTMPFHIHNQNDE